jgi:transposase
MTGVEQLPLDPQALMEIILRQRAEMERRELDHGSALEWCDIHIEKIQQEAAAAIAQRDAAIAARAAEVAQRDAAIEQIRREAAEQMEAMRLKHQAEVHALLRRFYGPRNERFDPAQLVLFGQLIASSPLDVPAVEQESGQKLKERRPRHKHGRQNLPEHLPRITVVHDLPEDQKACARGHVRVKIGEEVTEQLEYHPASFKVLRHVRPKYGCAVCDQEGHGAQIELAPKPPQPIEKGLAGPGLLAYVITSKLADHLPLYRLEKIFARHDLHVAGSTMCGWIMSCAELVAPLVLLMARRVKQSRVINTDETRVPVQDSEAPTPRGQCHQGRMWVYIGDDANPYLVYDYSLDRTNAWPLAWLEGFSGYLQADAYTGYDAVYRQGKVIEVGCWAHARRKFFDAKETDSRRAAEMLSMVRDLYAVEDQAKEEIALLTNATPGQAEGIRRDLRQQKSVPLLAEIKAWLDKESKLVLPRSPMAEAINYVLNQWDAMCIYTSAGFLNIDNNAAERAMKLIALGRKNWLFAGNDAFARHYATLYSLIASAQRHGLDPQAYLTGVLAQIAVTPLSELDQFLPDVWKARLLAEKAAGNATTPAPEPPASPAPIVLPGPGP